MGEIKPISEIIREKIIESTDAGAEQFISSIRPIYGSSRNGTPKHIGTCILLEIARVKYIITAAHVFDENEYTSLYLGARGDLELLEGDIFTTRKIAGKRCDDHFDFAWMKLSSKLLVKLDNVKFISENDLTNEKLGPKGRQYLALGYPSSKNKKIYYTGKLVVPKYH